MSSSEIELLSSDESHQSSPPGKKRILMSSSKSESEIAPKIKQEKSPTKLRRNYNSLCIEETNEELKYRRKRFPDVAKVIEENVKCTSCTRYLKELIIEGKNVYRHPTLNVLLCQKCSGFYDDGDFSVDEDGTDKYCRWCGQGGMLYCCAKCTCAFCKACIKRNLKRSILNDIESENWLCFICDSKPLWELRSFCWAAQAFVNKEKKRIKHDRQEKLLELERKHKSPKERRLLRRGKSNDSPANDSETSFASTSRDRLRRADRSSHNKRKHANSTSSDSKEITAKNIKKYKSFDTKDRKTTRNREGSSNSDDILILQHTKKANKKESSSDDEFDTASSRQKRTQDKQNKSFRGRKNSSSKDEDVNRPKKANKIIKLSKYKESSSDSEDDAPFLRQKKTKELIKSSKYKESSSDKEDDAPSSRPKRTKELIKSSKYKESSSANEDDASTSRPKRTKGKTSKYKENSSDDEDDVPSSRAKRTKEKLIKSSKYLELSLKNENDSSFSKSNRASKNPYKSTKNKESHSDSSLDETTKKQKKTSVYRERSSDLEDKRFSVKKKGESRKKLLTSKTSDSITEEIKTTSKNEKRKLKGDGDATSECEGEDLPKLADKKSAQKAITWLSENCSNIVDLGTLVAGRINKLKENKIKLKTTMKPQKVAHLVNGLRSFLNVFREDLDNVEALLDLNHEHWQKIVCIRERKKRKRRSRNKDDDDNNINEMAFQDSFKPAEANYNDAGVSSENINTKNQEQDIVTNKDSPANVEQEIKSKYEKFENSELNSTKLDKCSSKMITNEPSSSNVEEDTSKPKKKTDIEETTQNSSDKELAKEVREEHDLNESVNDSDEELLSNKANKISNKVKQFKNKNDKLTTSDDESNSFESHDDTFKENNKSIGKFKKKCVLDNEKSCERSSSFMSDKTQDDDTFNETTDNLLNTSIPKQINEVESINTQPHNASQDMFSDDGDCQSNGSSNILKCIEKSEDILEHTEYDSNAKHLYTKDKEPLKSDNTIRTSTLPRNDSPLTQPNMEDNNESFKEKEIDDADKESISESISTIEILNKSVDDSIFNETTQSIEDTNFLKIVDSEKFEKNTEDGNSEYADVQAENSDCEDPLAIESAASDDEAFMGNMDSIISNKNENIVLDDNEKMKVNEHLFTESLREDDTFANVQNNQMKDRYLTEVASLKDVPSHNENTENFTEEAETVKAVILREFSSDPEIVGNNIDKDSEKTAKHYFKDEVEAKKLLLKDLSSGDRTIENGINKETELAKDLLSDDEIVYDHSKEGEKAKADFLKDLLSDDENVENDRDKCTEKVNTVNLLCKEDEKAKADLGKDVLNNDETVKDDLGKCTVKAKMVNDLDYEKAKADLLKDLLSDDESVEDTLDKCTEKEKTVYDVGKEAEKAKEALLKDVLSDDETLKGGLDECTEKAKTVNDLDKEAGNATATSNDTLSIGDKTVAKDLSIEAEKAKAAILNDSSSDDETLANYLSIEAEKAKTAMLEESSDDEKVKNDIIKEAETIKALLLAYSSDETSDTNEHNNLKNRMDPAKKTKVIQNCPTDGRIRPKIGPKSRVKKDLECDVELYVTDSEDSSGNTKTKRNIRKNKFKIEETEAYKNDIKLGWKFEVTIERLPDTEFKKYYSNYVEIDETNEEMMKDTKSTDKNNLNSLLNLNSLKRPRKQNEGSSGSDCSVKTNKKKPKEEKIKKVKETPEDDASDPDDDSLESDNELKMLELRIEKRKSFLSKNEVAKRMLLALDSENENDSKEETEEEEEDGSKKKSKPKSDELNSEKAIKKDKETNDLSESESKERKKDWRRNKLLIGRLSETDSSDEEKRWSRKKKKEEEMKADNDNDSEGQNSSETRRRLKKTKRRVLGSDSDDVKIVSEDSSDSNFEVKTKRKGKKKSDSEKSIRSLSDSDSSHGKKKQKRRRIKAPISDSSDSEGNLDASQRSGDTPGKGRKNIRRMMKDESVGEATRRAAREEEERKKRIIDKQKMYNELYNIPVGIEKLDKLVLDFDLETKEELVSVHPKLVQKLKPHQAQGVKFMWDACFESVKQMKKSKGSGCILAHCMGLGKTFQVVTLVHTLLEHEVTKVKTVLIVCPLSTVLNWVAEFNMWLKDTGTEVNVFDLSRCRKNYERVYRLKEWQEDGGVMVIGYDMFRNLVTANTKKLRKKALDIVKSTLLDPGPDLVVCDEGHLLKNEMTALSKSMTKIRTLRRIVLTGTPLQNNLTEYHCMVQFVKPRLLGTSKEFKNRFVNPIVNGQFEDSTANDVKVMKRRAHVLHKMLEGSVQRFDYAVLTPFLPPKQEYVIFIRLTDVQIKIYRHYLDFYSQCSDGASKSKGARLFSDFQNLQRIWTHPRVLMLNAEKNEKIAETKRLMESDSEGSLKDFIDDSDSDSNSSEEDKKTTPSDDSDIVCVEDESTKTRENVPKKSTRRTRNNAGVNSDADESKPQEENVEEETKSTQWWSQFVKEDSFTSIHESGKLMLLFSILRECEKIGDKLLLFSQSLSSLNLVEYFLGRIDEATQNNSTDETLAFHTGTWVQGLDYFRLDGSTSGENRSHYCKAFNNEENHRARFFLISTRAGGLGINLFAANRVIIFDASWNPSHDVQSIFRIYRFGQKKPCYIYRFLASGTMEEKIYDRQVTKLSLSCRVVDEQQIERHYNMADLQELYTFDPEQTTKRPIPILPKDRLLAELLKEHEKVIENYHEHDSLLENKQEEELNEEERKAAWEDYENEKKPKPFLGLNPMMINQVALKDALRRENPDASETDLDLKLNGVLTELLKHYQIQQAQAQAQAQAQLQQFAQPQFSGNQHIQQMDGFRANVASAFGAGYHPNTANAQTMAMMQAQTMQRNQYLMARQNLASMQGNKIFPTQLKTGPASYLVNKMVPTTSGLTVHPVLQHKTNIPGGPKITVKNFANMSNMENQSIPGKQGQPLYLNPAHKDSLKLVGKTPPPAHQQQLRGVNKKLKLFPKKVIDDTIETID